MERWREGRLARLLSPTGWLTLVDRIPLEHGDNELPIGVLTLRDGEGVLRVREGSRVTSAGNAVREWTLRAENGGSSERLTSGGRTYEMVRRGTSFAVRIKDPMAPSRLGFRGLSYYPIDPAWRIAARWERWSPPRVAAHQYDVGGTGRPQIAPGVAHFSVDGVELALEPVLEEDSQRLFFIFGDLTNATDSYPAGRFLYSDLPAGDEVVLDFNTAFNPPCAFTAFASCPITPPRNRLPLAIRAGEKRYDLP